MSRIPRYIDLKVKDVVTFAGGEAVIKKRFQFSEDAYSYLLKVQDRLISSLHREGHPYVMEVDPSSLGDWCDNRFPVKPRPNRPAGSSPVKGKQKRTRIYDRILAIEAIKGDDSLWPKEHFRHDFTGKDAEIIGNPDGSLTVRSRSGKKLWKQFNYSKEDYQK